MLIVVAEGVVEVVQQLCYLEDWVDCESCVKRVVSVEEMEENCGTDCKKKVTIEQQIEYMSPAYIVF